VHAQVCNSWKLIRLQCTERSAVQVSKQEVLYAWHSSCRNKKKEKTMSWSISTDLKNEPNDMFTDNKLQRLREIDRTNIGNQDSPTERDHQIDAAINAAALLIVQGGFVENAAEIAVSLSGHANPEHKAAAGYARDTITVSISVKSYRPEE